MDQPISPLIIKPIALAGKLLSPVRVWTAIALVILVPLAAFTWVWEESDRSGSCKTDESLKQAIIRIVGIDGVTGGCRTPARNRRVGGAPNSLHKYGKAVDVSVASMTASKMADLRSEGFCAQYHAGNYYGGGGAHYHVVPCSTSASRQRAKGVTNGQIRQIRQNNRQRVYGNGSRTTIRRSDRNVRASSRNYNRSAGSYMQQALGGAFADDGVQ